MWNRLQTLTRHPAVQLLKTLCGDPVQLYCVFLVMTAMHYYDADHNWIYTIISIFASFVLMRFYDFVAKHRWFGPLLYMMFLTGGIMTVQVFTAYEQTHYPISFLVWFLTPQSVVEYSRGYTITMYLLLTGFLSGTVYYFSKVQYRMLMQFVIMIIPLSLYAKEGIQMPAIFVILLLAAYFLLMIYCRQIRYADGVTYVPHLQSSLSIFSYVAAFSILAAVVPKPPVNADRTFIENAMSYSTLSDVLMNAISMFTDVTDGGNASRTSNRVLYYAESTESLRLRTQSFSHYHEDDTWSVQEYYDYPSHPLSEGCVYSPEILIEGIARAAGMDAEFAEAYGLEVFTDVDLPALEERELQIVPQFAPSYLLPSPTRMTQLDEEWIQDNVISLQNTMSLTSRSYRRGEAIQMSYYPDTYAQRQEVRAFLECLSNDHYAALLEDAARILEETEPDTAAFLTVCREEFVQAMEFLEDAELYDWHSDAIDQLAEELTHGLTSDYEKAHAIEQYFTEQGFVYDLRYRKSSGDNAETFLFTSKRGVCYEFATAMVLLCRSAGLPARYMQGYSMNEITEQNGMGSTYTIRMRDAHAFPEVYISGYGWLSFEPTVASVEQVDGNPAEHYYVMIWGFVFLGLAGIVMMCIRFLPLLREKLFRRKLSKMQPVQAAAAMFVRMRKLLSLPESATVAELAEASLPFCAEIPMLSQLPAALDQLFYAEEMGSMDTAQLTETYIRWQESRKAYEAALKEEARRQKRQNRRHKIK